MGRLLEKIYGYAPMNWQDYLTVDTLITQTLDIGGHGIYCLDKRLDDNTVDLAGKCKAAGLDFILGFRWPTKGIAIVRGDFDILYRAKSITNRLALGNVYTDEWYGGTNRSPLPGIKQLKSYKRFAKDNGIEWVCCITHRTVCNDIKMGHVLKPELLDIQCICLCGYVLAGYCYADKNIPHQANTSLFKRSLYSEYGLCAKSLKCWLKGMNCITGVGYQPGLDAGSRVYAKELGFSGIVAGLPANLDGTDKIKINKPMMPPPVKCGVMKYY